MAAPVSPLAAAGHGARGGPGRPAGLALASRLPGRGGAAAGRAARAGFTLIELLVVIALIALVLALIPGFLVRSQPGLDLDVAARALADGLRQTRSEAVFSNRARVFTVDVEARRFRAGPNQAPKQLDRTIQLSLLTANQELIDERAGQIRFFPDGSSTGGRLRLALAGRQADVLVDWLTGQVAIADVAPE